MVSNEVPVPPELRRLRLATVAFALLLTAGVVGYVMIEDMRILEALYMTVITVTTVGFGEIVELSDTGRLWTLALIVAGVSTVSYAALTAAEFVVEGHLGNYIERRRMTRAIDSLHDHVIICGFGRVGRHLASALADEGVPHVMIDDDAEKLAELEDAGTLYVAGDATAEHTLEAAGLHRARALVACVNTDADNVLVTLTSKGLRPELTVVGRAKSDENERKLRRAGADRVILPSNIGARRIASLLTRPVLADFLEGLGVGAADLVLEEIPVDEDSPLAGISLRESAIRERWGVTVLAVRSEGAFDKHPSAERPLSVGDVLVVIGADEQVRVMRDELVD